MMCLLAALQVFQPHHPLAAQLEVAVMARMLACSEPIL